LIRNEKKKARKQTMLFLPHTAVLLTQLNRAELPNLIIGVYVDFVDSLGLSSD
jgi:hypothetical protein